MASIWPMWLSECYMNIYCKSNLIFVAYYGLIGTLSHTPEGENPRSLRQAWTRLYGWYWQSHNPRTGITQCTRLPLTVTLEMVKENNHYFATEFQIHLLTSFVLYIVRVIWVILSKSCRFAFHIFIDQSLFIFINFAFIFFSLFNFLLVVFI